jgi:hypothetical protein
MLIKVHSINFYTKINVLMYFFFQFEADADWDYDEVVLERVSSVSACHIVSVESYTVLYYSPAVFLEVKIIQLR